LSSSAFRHILAWETRWEARFAATTHTIFIPESDCAVKATSDERASLLKSVFAEWPENAIGGTKRESP
ncbi:hypothetical protein ACLI4Y_06790, partial [Natrialbaceae archaeon A-CW3]